MRKNNAEEVFNVGCFRMRLVTVSLVCILLFVVCVCKWVALF